VLTLTRPGCLHCHKEQSPRRETALPVYHQSSIPTPAALRRSVPFDHARHRVVEGKEVDCRFCHDASATNSGTVMLPSITACQKCHKPAGELKGPASGLCVTCHRYHDWRKEHASRRGPATPAP
jgi:hypothetical protein